MYTLLIDGNFFGQRILHVNKLTFMRDPKRDEKLLIDSLTEALVNEVKPLIKVIDSIIIARDHSSWRKHEKPIIASEILADLESDEIKYKANRDKDVKKYDDVKYDEAFNKWCSLCEEKLGIPIISHRLAEADDVVYVLSLLYNNNGKKTIMWTSDGDYPHMVNENNVLIKLPQKELFIKKVGTKQNVVTLESLFSNSEPDRTSLLYREFQGKVVEINPMASLFLKLVIGDKKDNVYPLFQWKSKTGTRNYKPSEPKILTALEKMGESLDTISMAQMYDDKFISTFIFELLKECKQTRDIKELLTIYKWNRKVKHLHKDQIPMDIIKGIYQSFQSKKGFSTDIETLESKTKALEKFNVIEVGTFFDGVEIMDY